MPFIIDISYRLRSLQSDVIFMTSLIRTRCSVPSVSVYHGAALHLVSYAAVICVVTHASPLRDDTNNGCVGDYTAL